MPLPTASPVVAPDALRAAEYAALRATIRERGTRRVGLVVLALAVWGALVIAVQSWTPLPILTLVPLIVLASGFEAAFALHVGVERIGRYLQVAYETDDGPQWEHTAMRLGATPAAGRIDPLFSALFILATTINFVPVLQSSMASPGLALDLAVFGLLHLSFVVRVVLARGYAARQRELDLAAIRALRD